jgi:hypothetical protein
MIHHPGGARRKEQNSQQDQEKYGSEQNGWKAKTRQQRLRKGFEIPIWESESTNDFRVS